MSVDLIRFLIFVSVLVGLVLIGLGVKSFRPYLRDRKSVV